MMGQSQSVIGLRFKQCPACGASWASRDDFLADPGIRLVGYQVDFRDLVAGVFLFNHNCGDTIAVPAKVFRDFYDGPVFVERATGTESCTGLCLREEELDSCPTHCECAFVRDILQTVKKWPKAG
jgi:hypothetical protein